MPRFHKNSIFGPGRRVPLDREQRAVFKAKLKLQRRPGRLTIAAAVVGHVLADMLGPDGRLDPTLATLATLARVSLATAKRAVGQLRALGFLAWERRLIRGSATGWRVAQTSNAYILRVPSCEAHFAPRVPLIHFKKEAREASSGWEAQVANARQQLAALGAPVPAAWG